MEVYKKTLRPVLDRLDSETWHVRARELLHLAEASPVTLALLEKIANQGRGRFVDERLRTTIGTVTLENPVLLAAGWDKPGRTVEAIYRIGAAGAVVGAVLEHAQPGNEKPRQFSRGGVGVNALGFNSQGMEVVAGNLNRYQGKHIHTGINVGINHWVEPKNAPEAYAAVVRRLSPYAAFWEINVSSPNTVGLRELSASGYMTDIVQTVQGAMEETGIKKDVWIKDSPDSDLQALEGSMRIVVDNKLAGLVEANTTVDPEIKAEYGWRELRGGFSGDNDRYRDLVDRRIAHIFRETNGEIQVIGVGGVKDAQTVWKKITAGAVAVGLVTAMKGEGLAVFGNINRDLVGIMESEGVWSLQEVRGRSANKYS